MRDLTDGLTGTEAAVLLVLAAESRPVRNPELRELAPELTAPARRRLVDRGLIGVESVRRTNVLTLTDRGWAAAAALTRAAPTAGSAPLGRALFTVARAVGRYLDRESIALGEVFGPPPLAAEPAPGTVADRVRAAYHSVTGSPGGWVRLRTLRESLPGLARADVDAALTALYATPDVDIVAEENSKALTSADRDAAVRVGGRDLHALRVIG